MNLNKYIYYVMEPKNGKPYIEKITGSIPHIDLINNKYKRTWFKRRKDALQYLNKLLFNEKIEKLINE